MSASDQDTAPEFSRPFAISELGDDGTAELSFAASESERAALAERFELQALNALSFKATVKRWRGGVHVIGEVHGEAVQTCVVTLGPVDETIEDTFERGFLPKDVLAFPEEKAGQEREMKIDREIDDAADVLHPVIDLGELAAEALSLALDPYPRAPDASLDKATAIPRGAVPITDADMKPFAALAQLKAAADAKDDDGEQQ